MHACVRRALCTVGLAGGLVLLGFGLAEGASADDTQGPVTTGESGLLSGNQTSADVKAPINLSGNQVTVIGQRNTAGGGGSASAGSAGSPVAPTTSGESGIGSGNQTGVDAQVPVNVSGNQVTVVGQDNVVGGGGGSSAASAGSTGSSGSPVTSGESGIGSGNQTGVDAQVPVNVSGNQVTVIGQDNATTSSGSATAGSSAPVGAAGVAPTTTGESGLLSGNQTAVLLALPVDVSGNQVTVIGQDNVATSTGSAASGADAGGSSSGGATTSGESGALAGNQTGIALALPANLSGNQVTVIGQDNTATSSSGADAGTGNGNGTEGATTSGANGAGSGNQTTLTVRAPVTATGDQATVVGQDNTLTSSGSTTTGDTGGPGGGTTTGADGIGSGNQTPIEVAVPVDASGNQVTVIGEGNTSTSTSSTGTGATPPGGGVVSPPTTDDVTGTGGGDVAGPSVPEGAAPPTATALPDTGLAGGLPALALLGFGLVLAGYRVLRRTAVVSRVSGR